MVIITDKGISGLVGEVVIYNMNGKTYVRSRSKKREKKIGETANNENSIFGTISKYGSAMAKMMAKSFGVTFRLPMYNALHGYMRNQYATHKDDAVWELAVKRHAQCQLNPEADLRDLLGIDIMVTDTGNGTIKITVPAMNPVHDIKATFRTKKIRLKLIALTSTFKPAAIPVSFTMDQYELNYSNETIPS